jgi:hypothetical protein
LIPASFVKSRSVGHPLGAAIGVDLRRGDIRDDRKMPWQQNLPAGGFLDFRLFDPFVGDAVKMPSPPQLLSLRGFCTRDTRQAI